MALVPILIPVMIEMIKAFPIALSIILQIREMNRKKEQNGQPK